MQDQDHNPAPSASDPVDLPLIGLSNVSADRSTPTGPPITPSTGRRAMLAGIGGLAAGAVLARRTAAGPLDPPAGPVAPTPGPEPRTPINQDTTPGDATSIFRITQPGSYYLTGNLNGLRSGRNGISIAADGVRIDLMGFAVHAGGSGGLSGIVSDGDRKDIAVRNGTVSGWGESGVNLQGAGLGEGALVEDVAARDNGGFGILLGNVAVVRGCTAVGNVQAGIRAGAYAVIESCAARSNGGAGFETGVGGAITGCAAHENGSNGFTIGTQNAVSGCSAGFNGLHGFSLSISSLLTDSVADRNDGSGVSGGFGCTVAGCTARNNSGSGIHVARGTVSGCTAASNAVHGITAGADSIVRGNLCTENGVVVSSSGILTTGSDTCIENNTCSDNDRGITVLNAGNFIVRNICSSNSIANWDIVAGNKCLVVNGANAGAINGNAGGVSPGSTDPWANFTY